MSLFREQTSQCKNYERMAFQSGQKLFYTMRGKCCMNVLPWQWKEAWHNSPENDLSPWQQEWNVTKYGIAEGQMRTALQSNEVRGREQRCVKYESIDRWEQHYKQWSERQRATMCEIWVNWQMRTALQAMKWEAESNDVWNTSPLTDMTLAQSSKDRQFVQPVITKLKLCKGFAKGVWQSMC